ncbi:hypothetical protein Kirov_204 [Bacillus phage Kirov]|uniref:Uncharacterized protein n=1 Tax=Bacillus phage Kirov TaxID=2783539 RepID=A0A7U3RXS0_9CAUD|nr:hypothetical protein PQE67_gp100 [Bacillus phage Kirov]QOV08403.1 hypothetical protein Kirov_204 [Bacillus phage Kirov]
MGKTTIEIKLANGEHIKEVVTSELIEYFAVQYKNHVEFSNRVEAVPYTFEQFVAEQLKIRKEKIRKAVESINGKEK